MQPSIPDGAWPILLTPFTDAEAVDFAAYDALIAFYETAGASGILALGQASEVLKLSDDERFAIAQRLGELCAGRIPFVAVGNYGATLAEQANSLTRVAGYGAHAAVVALSLLPERERLDDQLIALAERVDPAVWLGIYELPEPEHRLLTPEGVRRVAQTGRYLFMKDTCRQIESFSAKVQAAEGTALNIFQANMKILPPSMLAGGHGFAGWMAMVAPERVQQVCDLAGAPADVRAQAYEALMAFQTFMVAQGFPASAKHILRRRGLPIAAHTRGMITGDRFGAANERALDAFLAEREWFAPIGRA